MRRLRSWARWLLGRFRQPTVQPQALQCLHRWPDGTSAWSKCTNKSTTCGQCGARRKC